LYNYLELPTEYRSGLHDWKLGIFLLRSLTSDLQSQSQPKARSKKKPPPFPIQACEATESGIGEGAQVFLGVPIGFLNPAAGDIEKYFVWLLFVQLPGRRR